MHNGLAGGPSRLQVGSSVIFPSCPHRYRQPSIPVPICAGVLAGMPGAGHSGDAGGLEHSPAEFLKQYKVEEELIGVGSFSSVRRCVNRATGVEYAVKVVSK